MTSLALYEHRCETDEQQRRRRHRAKAVIVAAIALFALATRRAEVAPPPPPSPPPPRPVERVVTQTKVVTLLQTFEPFGPPPPSRSIVTPNAIAFDAQRVGTGSGAKLVSITNDGAYPLDARFTFGGDDGFTITNSCASKLPAHSQCAAAVVFQPRHAGLHRATLAMNAQHVTLTGHGVEEKIPPPLPQQPPPPPPQPAKLQPALVDPENIVFQSAGRERATITNPNDAPLRITAIDIVSGTPDGYKIPDRGRCVTTLAPHAQCSITILALPRAVSRRQTIRIHVSSE